MVTITNEVLNQGKSDRGGWSVGQIEMLGTNFTKGWRRRLLGSQINNETIKRFIELKNAHLNKSLKVNQQPRKKRTDFVKVTKDIPYSQQYKHPNWQRLRLEVLNRDKFKCRVCGDNQTILHVHHSLYVKDFYVWEVPERFLFTLCEKCHKEEHRTKQIRVLK